jgi:hypothetical protein
MARNYKKVSDCPEQIQKLIDTANSEIDFDEKFWFEIDFSEMKRQVRFIADRCRYFVDFNSNNPNNNSMAFSKYTMDFTQTLYFRIIENKITFAPNRIIEILQGADARRFRLCLICERVFWAKKLNHKTCGKRECAVNLGNKKRLDEVKEQKEKLNNHFQSRVKNNGTV